MPVVEVEVVLRPGENLPPGLAAALADGAGQVFNAPPGTTWVRLRGLDTAYYAESGGEPTGGIIPVFVTGSKPPGWRQRWRRLAGARWKMCTFFTCRMATGAWRSAAS